MRKSLRLLLPLLVLCPFVFEQDSWAAKPKTQIASYGVFKGSKENYAFVWVQSSSKVSHLVVCIDGRNCRSGRSLGGGQFKAPTISFRAGSHHLLQVYYRIGSWGYRHFIPVEVYPISPKMPGPADGR